MEQKPEAQAQTADASGPGSANASQRESVTLTLGCGGILGVKAGMTQVFTEDGAVLAVTVIDLKPTVLTQVKTRENDGYEAIQVGFLEKKAKSATKAEQGHAKKSSASGFYHYQEFRLPQGSKLDGFAAGKVLSAEFLKVGDYVDLTSISKGKGFQGGMKRYHMSGNYKTHGCSVSHRSLGSIGNRADPGKCWKNKKMPGQMGHYKVTVQNIRVARVDLENQVLLVNGSVPGPKGGIVTVQRAIKVLARQASRKGGAKAAKV